MRYRVRMMWVAALAVASAAESARATEPLRAAGLSKAAGPENWAARTDSEIARLKPPAEGSAEDPGALAVAAYAARPSDARRAAAGRVIRQCLDASLESADDSDAQMTPRVHAAALLAQIDDIDGARAMLEQARQVPPDYDQPPVPPEQISPCETAFVLQATGDADRYPEVHLKSGWMLEPFFEIAEDSGHPELSDKLRRLVSASPLADPDYENGSWAAALADDGFYPEAMAVAQGIGKAEARLVYEQTVAAAAADHGDRQYLLRYRQDFIAAARADSTFESWAPNVCEFLSRHDDHEGVEAVAPLADFSRGKAEAAVDHAELAAAFFRIGKADNYRREIRSAARLLASSSEQTPANTSANTSLAAAYARSGDKASVKKTLAKVRKKLGRTDDDVLEMELLEAQLQPVIEAYLEAGLVADAMSVADGQPDPIRRLAAGLAAHRLAKDGKFADARKLVVIMDAPARLGVYCFIAREQVRQKKTDGLAGWIDALPAASDRATLDVAVENALSGRRDREFERATDERVTPTVPETDDGPLLPNANGA